MRRWVCFIGFEWKGIKKGLRGYGFKVWLKPKAEPDAYGDAGAYGDEVDEDFEDRDNEDGADAHGVRFVEGGMGQVEMESSRAPGGGVAAVGANDVPRATVGKIGTACLDCCPVVSKEEVACLGGDAVRSGIDVPILAVDSAWGDEVVATTEYISLAGNS